MLKLTLLCGLLGVAAAAPTDVATKDVELAPVKWDVQTHPDGPSVTLVGTAQEVYKQVLAINPNYEKDFNITDDELVAPLHKRVDWDRAKTFCDGGVTFGTVTSRGYGEALDYFRRLRSRPRMDPGPRSCGRVSCSYDTAVRLCNDAPHEKWLDSWLDVRWGVEGILEGCGKNPRLGSPYGGQIFNKEDWNVILEWQRC